MSKSHISELICRKRYTCPVDERKTILVSLVMTPQGTLSPLAHISYTYCKILIIAAALLDWTSIYTWHLTDLWQNSNFLFVYMQEPISEFFSLHISLLPRYWSLNVSSTELSATESGFTTFTQTPTKICSWNMLTIDCSTLIVPEYTECRQKIYTWKWLISTKLEDFLEINY